MSDSINSRRARLCALWNENDCIRCGRRGSGRMCVRCLRDIMHADTDHGTSKTVVEIPSVQANFADPCAALDDTAARAIAWTLIAASGLVSFVSTWILLAQ